MTETTEQKKPMTVIAAMKHGKEYAALIVLLVSFLHSLYASYFKPERAAEVGYKTTAEAMASYSLSVRDEIESLRFRVLHLEDQVLKLRMAAQSVTVKPPRLKGLDSDLYDAVRQPEPIIEVMATPVRDGSLTIELPPEPWKQKH